MDLIDPLSNLYIGPWSLYLHQSRLMGLPMTCPQACEKLVAQSDGRYAAARLEM